MKTSHHQVKFSCRLADAGLADHANLSRRVAGTHDPPRNQQRNQPSNQPGAQATPQPAQVVSHEQIVSTILGEIHDLESRRKNSLEEMRQLAVELAVAIASKVLMKELQSDSYPFETILNSLVDSVAGDRVTILLNPQDLATLNERIGDGQSSFDQANVQLRAERSLPIGACRIESEKFTLLKDPRQQINQLRQLILESMDDASIERRQTEAANSPLQRFPDRRSAC